MKNPARPKNHFALDLGPIQKQPPFIRDQYLSNIKPMHDSFLEPSKGLAAAIC